ncbi:MAG TPA: hypothetical protein VGM13_10640 [Thermoanaerobaculia bacterium]|jgi:hypothetical protein
MKPSLAVSIADSWLDARRSIAEIVETLPVEPLPQKLLAHFTVINYRTEIAPLFDHFKRPWGAVTERQRSEKGVLYNLEFEGVDDKRRSMPMRLWLLPEATVAVLITVCSNRDWRQGVKRLLDALYPKVYSPFLSQVALRTLFDGMGSALKPHLSMRLTRVSSVRRLLQTRSRKRFESEVTWTDIDVKSAFEAALEEKSFFKNLAFEVCEPDERADVVRSEGTAGVASRDAHFAVNKNVRWLYRSAVAPLLDEARDRSVFLRGRGRADSPRPDGVRAIAARFTGNFRVTTEELPQLTAILRRYPDASVSILHANPYLDASVVDMRDGSSIELLLASENQMLLLPGLRATESALNRICRFLYEQVGEAHFADARS